MNRKETIQCLLIMLCGLLAILFFIYIRNAPDRSYQPADFDIVEGYSNFYSLESGDLVAEEIDGVFVYYDTDGSRISREQFIQKFSRYFNNPLSHWK